jgi:hypothetical protein
LKILRKKNCGKTMAEMEIQYQKELVAAEYRGRKEVSR